MEKLISLECMDCGKPFEQPPHPHTGQAFYYTCPECRRKLHEAIKRSRKGWGHGNGIYRGIKH